MRKQKVLPMNLPETTVVSRVQPLPAPTLPYWEIWRVGLGRDLDHCLLSRQAVALATHYVYQSNRTTPCLRAWCGQCPLCGTIARRYQAFFVVAKTPTSSPSIVAVPQLCVQAHLWLISSDSLFGRRITGRKDGRAHRSPISLHLGDQVEPKPSKRLAVDWQDLLAVLCNIWGVELPPGMVQMEEVLS